MATSEYAELESSDGSDTDSYDTLDPYYVEGKKKRRLILMYPAIVTANPSQYQISEQILQRTDEEGNRYTNLICLPSKEETKRNNSAIILPPKYQIIQGQKHRNRMSLTYMKTNAKG